MSVSSTPSSRPGHARASSTEKTVSGASRRALCDGRKRPHTRSSACGARIPTSCAQAVKGANEKAACVELLGLVWVRFEVVGTD
eukprot:363384-Chlamydomonas_euryale.AAC.7